MENKKRLIDANALKANFVVLGEFAKDLWHTGAIRIAIDNAPTVDAVEVKHGRWIVDESGVIICSECGAEHEWQDYRASFCEDCGAKKDGDGNA